MSVSDSGLCVDLGTSPATPEQSARWRLLLEHAGYRGTYCDPRWLDALCRGLRHRPYLLEARRGDEVVGILPLALVRSLLFGRFLVSLPYVNWAGVIAADGAAATALVDRAVALADELDVRFLELRHLEKLDHPKLDRQMTGKVQMRLPLSPSADEVWKQLRSVVRTQVRKGEKQEFAVQFGREELLDDFYRVFAENMRDLGTPVFGRRLFQSILAGMADQAELCLVRSEGRAIGGALVVHGPGLTEVPSASVLRNFRSTAANSLMYWRIVQRAVERGQGFFDFGRSTPGGGTFEFKKKWGAQPEPAVWQYYVRKGDAGDMRPETGKYRRFIAAWQRMPVWLTRLIGPAIVRGIP